MPTLFETLLEADTALAVNDANGPGLEVALRPAEGGEHTLRGLFEPPGLPVTPGQGPAKSLAPVLSTAPALHVQERLVQAALGRPLSTRDRFLVRGRLYRVQNPQPDGYGLINCKLLEEDDDDA